MSYNANPRDLHSRTHSTLNPFNRRRLFPSQALPLCHSLNDTMLIVAILPNPHTQCKDKLAKRQALCNTAVLLYQKKASQKTCASLTQTVPQSTHPTPLLRQTVPDKLTSEKNAIESIDNAKHLQFRHPRSDDYLREGTNQHVVALPDIAQALCPAPTWWQAPPSHLAPIPVTGPLPGLALQPFSPKQTKTRFSVLICPIPRTLLAVVSNRRQDCPGATGRCATNLSAQEHFSA